MKENHKNKAEVLRVIRGMRSELAERFTTRFRQIEAGVFPRALRAHVHRERSRWFRAHHMGRDAIREAIWAVGAKGPNRDNLWILRKAVLSHLSDTFAHTRPRTDAHA